MAPSGADDETLPITTNDKVVKQSGDHLVMTQRGMVVALSYMSCAGSKELKPTCAFVVYFFPTRI